MTSSTRIFVTMRSLNCCSENIGQTCNYALGSGVACGSIDRRARGVYPDIVGTYNLLEAARAYWKDIG